MVIYKDLTKEKIENFREIFGIFDTDGGGSIEEDEIRDVMRTLG